MVKKVILLLVMRMATHYSSLSCIFLCILNANSIGRRKRPFCFGTQPVFWYTLKLAIHIRGMLTGPADRVMCMVSSQPSPLWMIVGGQKIWAPEIQLPNPFVFEEISGCQRCLCSSHAKQINAKCSKDL